MPPPIRGRPANSRSNVSRSTSHHTHDFPRDRREEALVWAVPVSYQIPRKVVVKCLETLDASDSPDRPGMLYEQTLKAMVNRFDTVFQGAPSEARECARHEQLVSVVEHLRRHTVRRRGEAALQEGLVEWEHTKRIYELFTVSLNMFERIFFTVDVSESTSILSQICSAFLVLMIVLSIVTWIISTLPYHPLRYIPEDCVGTQPGDCAPEPAKEFQTIERLCVYVFTVEYLTRLFTVHSVRFAILDDRFLERVLTGGLLGGRHLDRFGMPHDDTKMRTTSTPRIAGRQNVYLDGPIKTTIRHVFAPASLIDLIAILPFWMEVVSAGASQGGALMVIRVLRLTRIFRVFKLGRYNEVFTLFSSVINQSMPALSLMLVFVILDCCLFGALIWFAEQGTWYPPGHEKLLELGITGRGAFLRQSVESDESLSESPFVSIVHAFWYVIVTITTVGYGDIAPVTMLGKMVGALTILNGIIVLAMPIGVVGANFSSEYYRVLDEKKRRARLKQQSELRIAVEEEQDAALIKESEEADLPKSPDSLEASKGGKQVTTATELHRLALARERILSDAEAIDGSWLELLPRDRYIELSAALRRFLQHALLPHSMPDAGVNGHAIVMVKPSVQPSVLADLDVLTGQVFSSIASSTSFEDLADLGLKEARELRQRWSTFTDRFWEYVIEMCRVETAAEPPEYFFLKAQLVRLSTTAPLLSPREAQGHGGGSGGAGAGAVAARVARSPSPAQVTVITQPASPPSGGRRHLSGSSEGSGVGDTRVRPAPDSACSNQSYPSSVDNQPLPPCWTAPELPGEVTLKPELKRDLEREAAAVTADAALRRG